MQRQYPDFNESQALTNFGQYLRYLEDCNDPRLTHTRRSIKYIYHNYYIPCLSQFSKQSFAILVGQIQQIEAQVSITVDEFLNFQNKYSQEHAIVFRETLPHKDFLPKKSQSEVGKLLTWIVLPAAIVILLTIHLFTRQPQTQQMPTIQQFEINPAQVQPNGLL